MVYKTEEKLILPRKVYITEQEYKTLRIQKGEQKISMAKIVCNLIIEKYGQHKKSAPKIQSRKKVGNL